MRRSDGSARPAAVDQPSAYNRKQRLDAHYGASLRRVCRIIELSARDWSRYPNLGNRFIHVLRLSEGRSIWRARRWRVRAHLRENDLHSVDWSHVSRLRSEWNLA